MPSDGKYPRGYKRAETSLRDALMPAPPRGWTERRCATLSPNSAARHRKTSTQPRVIYETRQRSSTGSLPCRLLFQTNAFLEMAKRGWHEEKARVLLIRLQTRKHTHTYTHYTHARARACGDSFRACFIRDSSLCSCYFCAMRGDSFSFPRPPFRACACAR